ncbi:MULTISPECIES: S41 family peptidase [unclassified Mesorhizobium]|uniref:S41 family peptidase n=1 Tax=unclassified Mesorhizobium TaxID=325217 RepID=UPI0007015AE6|nr:MULTISPECIES: S41 family peptidase [unclassified Mesorhizobium]KQZ15218.1 peptidase S41 [Mesorhizobium sp. Root1471]KQZ37727.1 peptidase S41 [Mesorhizobium sp. Root554]MDR7033632.1 carboxyl-terminal processing protease [Mesorhizobium sp. BE184]
MMRKVSLLLAGALMGASAMSLVYGAPGSTANAAGSETYKQLAIFGDIFERVRAQYVTPPDDKSLVENAINGMLTSLDPHSSYMNAEAAQDMRVQTKGEFGGLGIEVTMENDLVKVITPIDDTPAAKAGVLAGDYIAKIEGQEVRGLTLNDAVEKMRGPVSTPIKLTILRQGADKPIEITVVRDIIKVKAVKFRVDNNVGYMKITSFTEKTYDDLQNAISTIKKQVPNDKLKGYVLDLRLNPGGLLDQAVSVSDSFLDRGEIVSTRGRDPKDVTRFDARAGDDIDGKPLVVLVNGGSASASEIVAGALQDLRRATVVGTQSFGKGSVQTIIPLGENGALRLTTALYYTPSGKSIQGKGITPDIKVDQPLPEELQGRDLTRGESDLKGHIKGAEESDKGSGSAAYVPPEPKDDLQLIYAEQLLRGEKTDPAFPPNPDKAVMNQ